MTQQEIKKICEKYYNSNRSKKNRAMLASVAAIKKQVRAEIRKDAGCLSY